MPIRTSLQQDENAALDAVTEALASRPKNPIRLRMQPAIFWPDSGRGNYKSWPTVHWTVECDTVAEAMSVRDALRAFFFRLGTEGPAAVTAALTQTHKEEEPDDDRADAEGSRPTRKRSAHPAAGR